MRNCRAPESPIFFLATVDGNLWQSSSFFPESMVDAVDAVIPDFALLSKLPLTTTLTRLSGAVCEPDASRVDEPIAIVEPGEI